MTEWSQAVWIAINLLLVAFIITVVMYYITIGNTINNEISRQEANRVSMQEYREFNGYNENVVYAQDAVSAVLHYHGSVAVRIIHGMREEAYWCTDDNVEDTLKRGTGLINAMGEDVTNWSCDGQTTEFTATAVQEMFEVDKVYKGSLTYGPNGEVLGISFTPGTMDSDGNFIGG